MKNKFFTILMGLLLGVAFSSCTESNDHLDDTELQNSLIGNWTLTSARLVNKYDFNLDGVLSNDIIKETSCFNRELTFKSGGEGVSQGEKRPIVEIENKEVPVQVYKYIINCPFEIEVLDFGWELLGSEVVFSDIDFLNANLIDGELVINHPDEFKFDNVSFAGIPFPDSEKLTLIYSKQ